MASAAFTVMVNVWLIFELTLVSAVIVAVHGPLAGGM
jgi:hypothetical protein